MGLLGWFKRLLPFFATFVVAIFITSFFVDVGRPRFGPRGRWERRVEMQRLKAENEELRNENLRLQNEMENMRWSSMHMKHPGHDEWPEQNDIDVPPPPVPVVPKAK